MPENRTVRVWESTIEHIRELAELYQEDSDDPRPVSYPVAIDRAVRAEIHRLRRKQQRRAKR